MHEGNIVKKSNFEENRSDLSLSKSNFMFILHYFHIDSCFLNEWFAVEYNSFVFCMRFIHVPVDNLYQIMHSSGLFQF